MGHFIRGDEIFIEEYYVRRMSSPQLSSCNNHISEHSASIPLDPNLKTS